MREVDPWGIFLMETKINDERLGLVIRSLGFSLVLSVPPIGCKGGLAFYWRPGLSFDVLKLSGSYIHLLVHPGNNHSDFLCTFVHAPPY